VFLYAFETKLIINLIMKPLHLLLAFIASLTLSGSSLSLIDTRVSAAGISVPKIRQCRVFVDYLVAHSEIPSDSQRIIKRSIYIESRTSLNERALYSQYNNLLFLSITNNEERTEATNQAVDITLKSRKVC
jgi:hypothetical protein